MYKRGLNLKWLFQYEKPKQTRSILPTKLKLVIDPSLSS